MDVCTQPAINVLKVASEKAGFPDIDPSASNLLADTDASAPGKAKAKAKSKKYVRSPLVRAKAEAAKHEAETKAKAEAEEAAGKTAEQKAEAAVQKAAAAAAALAAAEAEAAANAEADRAMAEADSAWWQRCAPAEGAAKAEAGSVARLTHKLHAVVGGALVGEARTDARTHGEHRLEQFAIDLIQGAHYLRTSKKVGRMQKRKALTDLLKGLKKLGVSHHKAAVPPSQRHALAWFLQPPLEPPALFAAAALGRREVSHVEDAEGQGPALVVPCVGELPLPLTVATQRGWVKAEEYYFRSMARMQRLWELAGSVSTDLSGRDVDISRRMCEHLLHLQRRTRGHLGVALMAHDKLSAAAAALGALAEEGEAPLVEGAAGRGLPQQAHTRERLWAHKAAVDAAMRTAAETRLLWAAAAEVEATAAVVAAQRAAVAVTELLRPCQRQLNTVLLPPGAAETVTPQVPPSPFDS